MQGGRLACSSGLGRVLEDLPRLRPTTFAASPSFWNGLHKDFENQLRDRGDPEDDRWGMGILRGTSEKIWGERDDWD